MNDMRIYLSDSDESIARLAGLDSARRPTGRVLVAAIAGEPVAAVTLDGRQVIADPFRRTAAIVSMLQLRAAQLTGRSEARRGGMARRLVRARMPRPA